jgi:hypothetical protein
MWLSLSCRLVLPFLFVLGSDGCIVEEQQRFSFVASCLVAAITDIRTAYCCSEMDADGLIVWRGIDTT